MAALRGALTDIGQDPLDAELLFPGGATDMVEAFVDIADRRMVDEAGDLSALRTPARVRALLATRFRLFREHREAIRRAAGVLALPRHAALAARCTARTVDAMWFAAGDTSADFSWYTKRATLAAVYSATLLYWLRDQARMMRRRWRSLIAGLQGSPRWVSSASALRRLADDCCRAHSNHSSDLMP